MKNVVHTSVRNYSFFFCIEVFLSNLFLAAVFTGNVILQVFFYKK